MKDMFDRVSRRTRLSVLTLLIGMQGVSFAAAENITLKLGHTLPASHYIAEHLVKKVTTDIEAASGGEIKFELFPAGQLGKDIPGLLKSGLLDVGVVITGLYPEKYPLSSVAELPEAAKSACEGSDKMWALAKSGGTLDEVEYKSQGIRALSASLLAPYALFTRGKTVEKVSDVSGLKLWTSGPAAQKAVLELGGVPIRIPSPELYDAATRGTIDGAIFPYSGLTQYKLEPILTQATNGVNFGSGVFILGIAEKRWNEISEAHRKIISEQMAVAQKSFCEWIDSSNAQLRDEVGAKSGYVMTELDPTAKEEFSKKLQKVGEDWAADMDSKGRQGSAVLKAFREAAAQ